MISFWQKIIQKFQSLRPSKTVSAAVSQWLEVDSDQLSQILEALRDQLPTTEAIFIGKPQAGKSSIVRGLTGVSADIVGQGFRPHTQHTQQYAYPSRDLPLLVFTDTVGLGDLEKDTATVVEELVQILEGTVETEPPEDLKSSAIESDTLESIDPRLVATAGANSSLQQGIGRDKQRARIFVLTVKINDFAIATLQKIMVNLRQQYPGIPCLLVVTCLHEVYPVAIDNHPPYPPDIEKVTQSFIALQETLAGLYDRALLIDFTLEEDAYSPIFYGLEPLRDALADLLPKAEAQTLYQLLETDSETSKQLGLVYRDVGRRYVIAFSTIAATVAAVPLPFATMPVLTALQVSMVGLLGKLYGQTISPSQAGGIVSAIAGGFFAQLVGRELIKFIPGLGSVVAASWAAAYTWALGEGACVYFGDIMGGKKPDPVKIQAVMSQAFETAKQRFKGF